MQAKTITQHLQTAAELVEIADHERDYSDASRLYQSAIAHALIALALRVSEGVICHNIDDC